MKEAPSSVSDYVDDLELFEEESELSDKPWRNGRKTKNKRRPKYLEDDWEEQNRARKRYLKEWEEDMRYAEELANEGM